MIQKKQFLGTAGNNRSLLTDSLNKLFILYRISLLNIFVHHEFIFKYQQLVRYDWNQIKLYWTDGQTPKGNEKCTSMQSIETRRDQVIYLYQKLFYKLYVACAINVYRYSIKTFRFFRIGLLFYKESVLMFSKEIGFIL